MSDQNLEQYYWYFKAKEILYAQLENDEKHLFSFVADICWWRRIAIVGPKVVECGYNLTDNSVTMIGHITNRRVILEPPKLTEEQVKEVQEKTEAANFFNSFAGKLLSVGVSVLFGRFGDMLSHGMDATADSLEAIVQSKAVFSVWYQEVEKFENRGFFDHYCIYPIRRTDPGEKLPLLRAFGPVERDSGPAPHKVMIHLLNNMLTRH